MKTKIIEVTNNNFNWGKFLLARMDVEWSRAVKIENDDGVDLSQLSLLRACGWSRNVLWVLDLQTGEGACFDPSGNARADLSNRHQIWVCPMFEPFLVWLYQQDLKDLDALPDVLNLPDAPVAMHGYRRKRTQPAQPPRGSRLEELQNLAHEIAATTPDPNSDEFTLAATVEAILSSHFADTQEEEEREPL